MFISPLPSVPYTSCNCVQEKNGHHLATIFPLNSNNERPERLYDIFDLHSACPLKTQDVTFQRCFNIAGYLSFYILIFFVYRRN